MADLIKEDTGESTELVQGNRGELTIWVDGRKVAGKDALGFPAEQDVVDRVRAALGA